MKTRILTESTKGGADKRFIEGLILQRGLFQYGGEYDIYTQDIAREGDTGSVGQVLEYLKNLPKEPDITSGEIKNLLIIVDADQNIHKRFNDIRDIIKKNKDIFSLPDELGKIKKEEGKINVGVYLFPDCNVTGALENLILGCNDVFSDKKNCIEGYLACLDGKKIDSGMTKNQCAKAMVRIMATTPEPDNYVKNLIGLVDFESDSLDKLEAFLKEAE